MHIMLVKKLSTVEDYQEYLHHDRHIIILPQVASKPELTDVIRDVTSP